MDAELAAIIIFGGRQRTKSDNIDFLPEKGEMRVFLSTENDFVRQKAFTLCKKNISIKVDVEKGVLTLPVEFEREHLIPDLKGMLERQCCRRAFLRGAFLCLGSMSDPGKSYHLEFVCEHEPWAEQIRQTIAGFQIEAKIIRRKKYYVVYLKEGAGIVDLLNVIGAHRALMQMESLRVEKEVRNSINRQVNCEAANISKTVNAASKQIEDIEYLKRHYGLLNLPDGLRQMAEVRLEHPDSSLSELGKYLNPPVGKSGVNHRLRKLGELTERLRHKEEKL